MKNYQWIIKSPIYLYAKKHYCPNCSERLVISKASQIVSAGSEEAKRLGLKYNMVGGVYQSGTIKVFWKEFECQQCNLHFSVEKMRELEGYPK